jgi:hypothetical protein
MDRTRRPIGFAGVRADVSQVDIYSWPTLRPVGSLTGFIIAFAACSNANGDVWIVDSFTQTLYEFAHGGTKPIATLDDAPNSPQSCAVDPKSNDVAVGNDYRVSSSSGSVTIFRNATGPGVSHMQNTVPTVSGLDYGRTVHSTWAARWAHIPCSPSIGTARSRR